MEKIFDIAANVSTPLALAGVIATILFFILKSLISKNVFQTLSKSHSANIIGLIVRRLTVISIIAMLLGFIGFIFVRMAPAKIEGIVFVNNKEMANVSVKILESEKTAVTNFFGRFSIDLSGSKTREIYTARVTYKEIDTILKINVNEFENLNIHLLLPEKNHSKPEKTNQEVPKEHPQKTSHKNSETVTKPTKTAETPEIDIPSVFYPIRDKVFNIKMDQPYKFQASIYNRWGELIYKWTDDDKGWNGKDSRNGDVKQDSYYYLFDITIGSEKYTKEGQVSLIR